MIPESITTKIFLDSGDPAETKEMLELLGRLDGQTTNPSLVTKNPDAQARIARGEKFASQEIYEFYEGIVKEISELVPESVSIEVYADAETTADEMFAQAESFWKWIPNAHIKYPITAGGLEAAERSIAAGMRVNMTLCFSQEQAAAVYAATRGAAAGDVYLSPFAGRLDDIGQHGMGFIQNVVEMYKKSDGHVQSLAASIRSVDHLLDCFAMGVDIVTAPAKVYREWAAQGFPTRETMMTAAEQNLSETAYEEVSLDSAWNEYDIQHDLTDTGIAKFANDWNAIIE